MTELDLVFRGAKVVDGTGAPGSVGDVAVAGGRIVQVGRVEGRGRREVDGQRRVLSPGFIDIHTHYDPQICWDRLATPSLEHGCTTVVQGNCSLSLAPLHARDRLKLVRMFERIEDVREQVFDAAVPFTWESFPEYLDHIRPGLGINVGALVGHSALRYYVMGAASQERVATGAEVEAMCDLMRGAMQAGALGLSISHVDSDETGKPVPSRFADMREKIALARAMAESGRGMVQTVPFFVDAKRQLENIRELGDISLEAGVACSIAPIVVMPVGSLWKQSLDELERQRDRGARVYAQSMPRTFDVNVRLSETSFLLYGAPVWDRLMQTPKAERMRAFRDPATRKLLAEDPGHLPVLMQLTITRVVCDENRALVGRRLLDVAADRKQLLSETMLDIALADELETEFRMVGVVHADRKKVTQILKHPLVHIGASDAGAHVTQFCGAGDTTHLLGEFVREERRLSLEEAVHGLTGKLANAWGMPDRGTIEIGQAADLVLFDPELIDRGEEHFVHDFPAGAGRYLREAEGIDMVVVNGAVTVEDGEYTSARAGRIV